MDKKITLILLASTLLVLGGCLKNGDQVTQTDYNPGKLGPISGKVSEQVKNGLVCSISFKHVQPGIRSEYYLDLKAAPGTDIKADLTGPGIMGEKSMSGKTDAQGQLKLTWNINKFGFYKTDATGTAGGQETGKCSVETEVK